LLINLINLDRSPDRLAEFTALNRHLREIGRWSAVDGSTLDLPALIEQGLVARDIPAGFSKGILGSALSHIGLWDKAIETQQPLTISEDDAIFHRDFETHAASVLERLPPDCDIVLWGWNFDAEMLFAMLPGVSPCLASFNQNSLRAGISRFQMQPVSPQPFRLLMAFGIMCYTIFPAGARALKHACMPLRRQAFFFPALRRTITQQSLDITMAAAYPRLNAFVCFPPIAVAKNEHAKSLNIARASG
jgi:glycosyl transferase, family 25